MKKGVWMLLGLMLVGVGICLGSLMFAPRGAETPTPILEETTPPVEEPTLTPQPEPSPTEGVIIAPEPTSTKTPPPTPTVTLPGVDPQDTAYITCWLDRVMGPWDNVSDDLGALSEAAGALDIGTSKVWVSLLESDLQEVKAALLACPSPRHRLLVSSREKSLRSVDLMALYGRYMEEGLSTLDADLINKATDTLLEANGLLQEATSDIERYNVEVLGK